MDGIDTPHIGLFGKTRGEVWESPYPLGNWLQGKIVDCQGPCWHRHYKGYDAERCRSVGCTALLNIPYEKVLDAIHEVLGNRRVEWHVEGGYVHTIDAEEAREF
jgi:hypothetical protein